MPNSGENVQQQSIEGRRTKAPVGATGTRFEREVLKIAMPVPVPRKEDQAGIGFS
jgi:hypothetical protein